MKKFISLILTIALLATLMPTMLVNAASETVTVDVTESTSLDATYYSGYGGKAFGVAEKIYIGSANDSSRADYRKFLLIKASLASVAEKLTAGKTVTKVELIMTRTTGGGHKESEAGTFSFYNASTSWDATTTMLKDWDTSVSGNTALYPEININITEGVGSVDVNAIADATTSMTVPSVSATSNTTLTLDITGVYKAAFPTDNVDASSLISVLGRWDVTNTYHLMDIISSTYAADTTLRPKLKFTIDDIPSLAETSSTLPAVPSDEFALTVTNPINTAAVKVNDAEVDSSAYTVSGSTLTLDNYQLAPFTKYKVDVSITDYYNQQFTKTYNFETSYDAESGTLSSLGAYQTTHTATTKFTGNKYGYTYTDDPAGDNYDSNCLVLFNIGLPTVTAGYLESYIVNFSVNYPYAATNNCDRMRLYSYDLPANSAATDLVWSDLKDERNDAQWLSKLTYLGEQAYALDATEYAKQAIADGKSSIWIIADSVNSGSTAYKPASATYSINKTPLITISAKDVLPAGTTLKKADVTFITRFPASVTDYLVLRTAEGKTEVQGITFTYDDATGTVGIAAPVTGLSENTEYELVLKAGAQDSFNNSVTEDIVLQKFTATVDFALNELKILADSFVAGTDDFDSATTLIAAAENDQIKAVCEIVNNDQAKNVWIIIASYKDSSKSELSDVAFTGVTAELGENVYASEAITIESDAKYVKAFVWDGATYAPLTQFVDFER